MPFGGHLILYCLRYGPKGWPVPFLKSFISSNFQSVFSWESTYWWVQNSKNPVISWSFSCHLLEFGVNGFTNSACETFILKPIDLEIAKWTEISITMWIAGILISFRYFGSTDLTLGCAMVMNEQPFLWWILDHSAWLGEMNLAPTGPLPGVHSPCPQGVRSLGRETTSLWHHAVRLDRSKQGTLWCREEGHVIQRQIEGESEKLLKEVTSKRSCNGWVGVARKSRRIEHVRKKSQCE